MVLIANITPPEEGLIYTTDNLQLKIGDKIIGTGTLYICQSSLSWMPNDKQEGISMSWKQIIMHGIFPNPRCIYFMLDHQLIWNGVYGSGCPNNGPAVADIQQMNDNNDDGDSDYDEGNETDNEENRMTELWLIPSDINTVDVMFQAMNECQALYADSNDSISDESNFMDDEEDCNDFELVPAMANGFEGARNDGYGEVEAEGGMQNLRIHDDRFADAEEEDSDQRRKF